MSTTRYPLNYLCVWLAAIVLLIASCSRQEEREAGHDLEPAVAAERARDALLQIMRDQPAAFSGFDANDSANIPLEQIGPNEFSWGPIVIQTQTPGYSGAIPNGNETRLIHGVFRIEANGSWSAMAPTVTSVAN